MRGYFGFGVERVSKPMNLGNLYRTAHGFGASFLFTLDAHARVRESETGLTAGSDTSRAADNLPLFHYDSLDDLNLPEGCVLVGIELTDEAIDLPSFPHPPAAAYILGAEIYGLSPETLARCRHVIKIPTKFSLNLATAGAIVMYDRLRCLGRFADRPLHSGGARPGRESQTPSGGSNRPRVREDLLRREQARKGSSDPEFS
ncbi:RNA methyltransferase [Alphaproteobacteria bacterium LMG 31809]|uniref:RNA methyltransferase n=2 Tax=Govanella unica TaxID=2975056 RepID=A0A9X3TWC6_9PROT|nr:RNA methyltransferase [Govania unica]